jgi:hypothetical protein
MENSQSNKKKQIRRKSLRMVIGKNSWSFSWHREKFHKFVIYTKCVWVKNYIEKNMLSFPRRQEKLGAKKSSMGKE